MRTRTIYRKILLSILFSNLVFSSCAQLSGSYTIGGSNPDYITISDAIVALNTNGLSGNVEFNIRPGNYSGFRIDSTPTLAIPYSIIFQAETHDSNDVIISGYSSVVSLNNCNGVTLKWLKIEATSVSRSIAVNLLNTYGCNLLDCIISTPNSVSTTASNCAVFIQRNDPNSRYNTIAYCNFIGSAGGITFEYAKCLTMVLNNKILSGGRYSLNSAYSSLHTIANNILNGEVAFNYTTGEYFGYNQVTGDVELDYFNIVHANSFNADFSSMSGIYSNNIFNRFYISSINSPVIEKNTFQGQVNISRCNTIRFYNNSVYGNLYTSFSDNGNFFRNSIFGQLSVSGANYKIYCNMFYNYVRVTGRRARFYYNNFSPTGYIWNSSDDIEARYNNFSRNVYDYASGFITHNNYFPTGGEYDAHPFHYDPMYVSSSNIRAQNPLLTGKGMPVSYVTVDIDSVTRGLTPTIGANEICMQAFTDRDSINIFCGDAIKLKFCSATPLSGYSWHPALGLSDSLSISPYASPIQNTTYFLVDTAGIERDSVYIAVHNFVPSSIPDDSIACYEQTILSGSFNPMATYTWFPSIGLSDTTVFNPLANPPTTTTYIQQTNIYGCGVFYDTVTVYVAPLPIADGHLYNSGLNALIYNFSVCADSVFWNFGDGETSNLVGDTGIYHHYDSAGVYIISLRVCNVYGCDTFYFTVSAVDVGIKDLNTLNKKLQIFPNPAKTSITVKGIIPNTSVIITNVQGQIIKKYISISEIEIIDISEIACGIYFFNGVKFLKE